MIQLAHSQSTPRCVHLGLGWIGDKGGGLERYQDGICRQHFRAGVEVAALVQSRCAVRNHGSYHAIAFASPDERRRVKLRQLRQFLPTLFGSPSILVSHHASVSDTALPMIADTPHVVHFHGPWAQEARVEGAPLWKSWLQKRQETRVYRSADRILTLSKAFADLVIRDYGVDEDRVRVVPGAIDALAADPRMSRHEARMALGWPTDRPILLSIRRLVRRVGIDVLIGAVARLVRRHPDVLVLIGGTGRLQLELAARIHDEGLSDHVRLLGFVPPESLSTAYRACDFSVIPTQSLEGFGLVTLESMAAGSPAVVTPVGSLGEVVGPLSESLILPGKSERAIAEGLDRILSGTVRLPDDQACRDYVRHHFDWSVIAPRVLDVYREAGEIS